MKKIIVGAVVGVSLLLSGCSTGEVGTFDGSTQDQTSKGKVQTLIVNYRGKPLTCVRFNPDTRAESLSCDFIEYYNNDSPFEGSR